MYLCECKVEENKDKLEPTSTSGNHKDEVKLMALLAASGLGGMDFLQRLSLFIKE